MISRTHRFHGYGSLKKTYANGKSVRGGQIGLKFADRKGDKPYRVAVVISRKVNKSAVARNRMRRRIYEAIRTSDSQPKSGSDLIFTVFSNQIKDMPAPKLQTTVDDLIKKTL